MERKTSAARRLMERMKQNRVRQRWSRGKYQKVKKKWPNDS